MVFHFPKHIFLLFFVLVFTAFFSLGVAGYIWSMKTENVYYLEDKSIIGDYVVSPSDTIGRNGGEPFGIVPIRSNYYIENAEEISQELNSISGVKSLPVACVDSYFTFVIKGELKTKESWFVNKSVNNIGLKLQSDGVTYLSLRNTVATPYYDDSIYGVNSSILLDFYKEKEGFEFFGLTGNNGVFLSEAMKDALEIEETDKEVTLVVSYLGRTAFQGGIISVPIAGFFRAQEKPYEKEANGENIKRLRASNPVFMFLDMDYYSTLYKTNKMIFPQNEEYDDLLSSLSAKKGRGKTSIVPISYQNIWIRGENEDALNNVIAKTGQPLSLTSTFRLSLSLDRHYSFMTTLENVGKYSFLLMAIVIWFMAWSVVKRLLDYEEKSTLLMYASGSQKKSIILRLYLPIIIPSVFIGIFGLYTGLKWLQSAMVGSANFFVTLNRTIHFLVIPFSIVLIMLLLISLLSAYSFVNSHTSFESQKRRRK